MKWFLLSLVVILALLAIWWFMKNRKAPGVLPSGASTSTTGSMGSSGGAGLATAGAAAGAVGLAGVNRDGDGAATGMSSEPSSGAASDLDSASAPQSFVDSAGADSAVARSDVSSPSNADVSPAPVTEGAGVQGDAAPAVGEAGSAGDSTADEADGSWAAQIGRASCRERVLLGV